MGVPSQPTHAHLKKRVGSYYVGRTLGEGSFSKVKYGQHTSSGEAVAIKILDKDHLVRSGMVEQVKREVAILQRISHPHIVNLREVMASRDKIFMVMELVTGGDLFDRVVAEGPLKEPEARAVFAQLLSAVQHCHAHGIYHRDLKPENVLLSSDGGVKLSDFGLGSLPQAAAPSALLSTTCGTPNYVAPEVLARRGYSGGPADVWSLGVVLYVMLAACLPYDEEDLPLLFDKISRAEFETPPWLTPAAAALLRRIMRPDPDARPTPQELWDDPWVAVEWPALPGVRSRSRLGRPSMGRLEELARGAPGLFQETVLVEDASSSGGSASEADAPRRSAFELMAQCLDMSALFEVRDDLVTRHTRFTSRADVDSLVSAIDTAAAAVGGRVERRAGAGAGEPRLRVHIPAPAQRGGQPMRVAVDIYEFTPGMRLVDVFKVAGNTVAFYRWYSDLAGVVSHLMTRPPAQPGASPRARRVNAFELVAAGFDVGAMFEDAGGSGHAGSAHGGRGGARSVAFTTRLGCDKLLEELERAAKGLGASFVRVGDNRALLRAPLAGGRALGVRVGLLGILQSTHVVQVAKEEEGSPLEFFRFYGRLAAALQHVMMKPDRPVESAAAAPG